MDKPNPLRESRITTGLGAVLGYGGILMSILPSNVRDACVSAVSSSENPLFISIMVVAGLTFTVVGPSIASRKKPQDPSK